MLSGYFRGVWQAKILKLQVPTQQGKSKQYSDGCIVCQYILIIFLFRTILTFLISGNKHILFFHAKAQVTPPPKKKYIVYYQYFLRLSCRARFAPFPSDSAHLVRLPQLFTTKEIQLASHYLFRTDIVQNFTNIVQNLKNIVQNFTKFLLSFYEYCSEFYEYCS